MALTNLWKRIHGKRLAQGSEFMMELAKPGLLACASSAWRLDTIIVEIVWLSAIETICGLPKDHCHSRGISARLGFCRPVSCNMVDPLTKPGSWCRRRRHTPAGGRRAVAAGAPRHGGWRAAEGAHQAGAGAGPGARQQGGPAAQGVSALCSTLCSDSHPHPAVLHSSLGVLRLKCVS